MSDWTDDQRTLALKLAHVALPSYVIDCEPWESNDGEWTRLFTVKEWQIGAVLVAVAGEQNHRGAITCWVYVGGEDQFAGADQRALLTALREADELLCGLQSTHGARHRDVNRATSH